MANKKISELVATTTLADGDIVPVVTDLLGSPATKKITVADLKAELFDSPTFTGTATADSVNATTFTGSGSGLTNIPASQLVGAYGAANGSAITDLNASNLASGTVNKDRLPSTLNATRVLDLNINTVSTVPVIEAANGANQIRIERPSLRAGTHSTGAEPTIFFRADQSHLLTTGNYIGGATMADWHLDNNGTNSTISNWRGPSGTTTRQTSDDMFLKVQNKTTTYYIRLERWT